MRNPVAAFTKSITQGMMYLSSHSKLIVGGLSPGQSRELTLAGVKSLRSSVELELFGKQSRNDDTFDQVVMLPSQIAAT